MMFIAHNTPSPRLPPSYPHIFVQRRGMREPQFSPFIKCQGKRDPSPADTHLSKRVSRPVVIRSALALFGLGFIDAGYSGDWSRIGAISKELEDLLKVAAFVVVPLCIFAILAVSKEQDTC